MTIKSKWKIIWDTDIPELDEYGWKEVQKEIDYLEESVDNASNIFFSTAFLDPVKGIVDGAVVHIFGKKDVDDTIFLEYNEKILWITEHIKGEDSDND